MALQQAFLIDGTAFCYRAFYAIRGLSTPDGRPTNAVYGFAMMLNALRNAQHPDYLAVAFDAGKPTFRHERFEAYKGQRKPMPDLLIAQLPLIKALLAAYRLCVFELEGYEAEDLLATIARRILRPGSGRVTGPDLNVFLVTGDKDALQLVGPQVKVYNPHQDHGLIVDEQAVVERYGVPPNRLVDLMALTGDEIDNIPGVPGIGPKTASTLLQRFGTVEALYRRLDEVDSESQRAALHQHRQQVELARELARIDAEAPIAVDLNALRVCEPDWTALRRLFRQLEFKRLLTELDAEAPAAVPPAMRIHSADDPEAAKRLGAKLRGTQPAALESWIGPDARLGLPAPTTVGAQAGLLAVAWDAEEAWVAAPDQLERLRSWLASPDHPKIGHDLKRTIRWLRRHGYALEGVAGDTMIAAHLLNPSQADPTLQDLAEEQLDVRVAPLPGEGAAAPEAAQPLAHHVRLILQAATVLDRALRAAQLLTLYRELELPLVPVLAEMELAGVAIDQEHLARMRGQMEAKLTILSEELWQRAGGPFNLNSPKQLAEVLFQRLGLPVIKRTKTGPSTDNEVLQRLAPAHPFAQQLIEYRELSKLVSTYLEALPRLIDPETRRIHSTFHQTGTATGRLSSSDPNLQNIPVKTELGRQIRKAVIAGSSAPGLGILAEGSRGLARDERAWELLAADYSQIELRILAHLCGDPQLTEAFRQERDIHRATASLIHGVAEEQVTPQMRSAMKAVNFGILYGMSPHGLSRELGVPHEEAAAFIDAYFERYPKVRAFLDAQIARARQDGYVQTLLGRRRYIPEVNSPDPVIRQFGERMAVNAPIQGTAADLIKRAMVRLGECLRRQRLKSRMILQVHDELVFETPPQERDQLARSVRDIMEHAIELAVPLRVIVKRGPNWLEMTDMRLET